MFACQIDDHLALRLFSVLDAEEAAAVIIRNRERLAPWMGWATPEADADSVRAFITEALARWSRCEALESWLTYDGAIIGSVGMVAIRRADRWAEIGYWIDAAYEGRGFVTRAVEVVERIAFDDLGCKRVQIRCDAANLRSSAVPVRLGYTLEGTLRHLPTGFPPRVGDHRLYGLLRPEWEARQTR